MIKSKSLFFRISPLNFRFSSGNHASASHSHDAHHAPEKKIHYQTEFDNIFQTEHNPPNPDALYSKLAKLNYGKFRDIFSLLLDVNSTKTQQVSEYWNPPKLTENSIFVHQSIELANTIRFCRGAEYLAVGFLAGFSIYPLFATTILGISYYFWANAWFYEMSRRLVCRMDLLPHLEMVNIQRIGAFGNIYNKLIRIQDLEKVDFNNVKEKENYFWLLQNSSVDKFMIFKDKTTEEILLFDRNGIWNAEGLQHKLLI